MTYKNHSPAQLAQLWNIVTNPAKLRTNRQHESCALIAATVMQEFKRRNLTPIYWDSGSIREVFARPNARHQLSPATQF